MSTGSPFVVSPVLADLLPTRRLGVPERVRDAVAVVGFALLTALAAQVKFHLGFTPVPITGQTFAVLLAGGTLGLSRGAASQALYWAMGLVGLPFFAGGESGWESGTGATMGYLAGFVVASALIGYMAERRADRNFVTSLAAMTMGSVVIYAMGALWLAIDLGIPVANGEDNALALGVTPFLAGDALKILIASAITPSAWLLVSRFRR
ncbi:MAG: biotin transporter BioY [Ilumatobacteraceae bacterium]|jgi:biotin transport system substrate-specific component|nr:biotin transporter BioY [Ilumatobacteraceae bacterium]